MIARLLAEAMGARLLDNHTLLDPAEALFDRSNLQQRELRLRVREQVFDTLASTPAPVRLVFTDALGEDPGDRALFNDYQRLAERRGAPLHCVVLDCDIEEYRRRLVTQGRSEHRKLTDVSVLDTLRRKHRLLREDGCIAQNVSALTAQEACDQLLGRLGDQVATNFSAAPLLQ